MFLKTSAMGLTKFFMAPIKIFPNVGKFQFSFMVLDLKFVEFYGFKNKVFENYKVFNILTKICIFSKILIKFLKNDFERILCGFLQKFAI